MRKRFKIKSTRRVILVGDPAVDDNLSDWTAYRDSCWNIKHVVLKPGETPSYFTIKPLEVCQKRALDQLEEGSREASEFIVRCGLLKIEGYMQVYEDGSEIESPQPDRKDRGARFGTIASQEWIDSVDFAKEDLASISIMIQYLSEASPLSLTPSDKPPGDG